MSKWLGMVLCVLVICGGLVPCPAAELDEVQAHLLAAYPLTLRWENVEEKPWWLCGVKPRKAFDVKMDVVYLAPGAETTFRVPPWSMIRVLNPYATLQPDDVEVWLSDGSGLWVNWSPERGDDGKSVLVSPCDSDNLVARVVRPANAACPITVGLFIARTDPLGEIAPYRCPLSFPTKPVKVTAKDQQDCEHFWPAAPGTPLSLDVEGPTRIVVRTRLHYPPNESQLVQAYRVNLLLNGRPFQVLEYETGPEFRERLLIDGHPTATGRLETAYAEIPPGKHSVSFDVTAPLFVRVLAQKSPDYLAPKCNQPVISAEQARRSGVTDVLRLNPWDITRERAEAIVAAGPTLVAERERLALRLVRDNSLREGGLTGTMLLRETALARPDYPRVRSAAEKLGGFHTFYRDLLPTRTSDTTTLQFAWFAPRRLRDQGECPQPPVVPAQLIEGTLDRLPSATFVPLPSGRDAALVYPIPERFSPSRLQVAVEASGARELFVQYDESPPFRLRLAAVCGLKPEDFVPEPAEAALAATGGSTLGGRFTTSRPPGPLIRSATAEVPLPEYVKRVRVWAASPGQPLRVAVQYRASRPYQLSETAYRATAALAGERGGGSPSFVDWIRGQPAAKGDPLAVRELANQWEPLGRLLRQQDTLFRSAVEAPSAPAKWVDAPNQGEVESLVRQARARERDGNWLAALETWSRLLPLAGREERRLALLGRAEALNAMGERFLADRLLRGVYLFDPDETARNQAFERLAQWYAGALDREALESLLAVECLRNPTPNVVRRLAEVLLDNDEVDAAQYLAISLPRSERPIPVVLRAAYRLRWWQLFEETLAQLPTLEERRLWQARRALASGDEQTALALFRDADKLGRLTARSLEEGLALRADLKSPDLSRRATAIPKWGQWQADQPGPRFWRDEPNLVADAFGFASVYSIDRDRYAHHAVADPKRPVVIRVIGPLRLKVEARPVHGRDSPGRIDDWLTIREEGQLRLVPITGNIPSDGLVLIGDATKVPGVRVTHEFDVGPGMHQIALAAESHPVLVRVSALRPEIPVSVLPPLTEETVAQFLPDGVGHLPKPQADEGAALVAEGKLEQALRLPPGHDLDAVLRRMTLLLRLAETDPAYRAWAVAEGEALFTAHPTTPGLPELHERLTRHTVWAPVTNVLSSAGLRQIPLTGWNPESPALRRRKALMNPLHSTEHVVTGDDRLVLSMNNLRETTIDLDLLVEDVAFLPRVPTTVVYQIDEREPVKEVFTPPASRREVSLTIPAGPHGLRVWIERPIANQYLRVRAREKGKDLPRDLNRTYQIATADEPVVVEVTGPTWLRIDEVRNGETLSRFQLVPVGDQKITLKPPAGQKEAPFRVFQRAPAPDDSVVPPRTIRVPTNPVPPPFVAPQVADAPPVDGPGAVPPPEPVWHLEDIFALGKQEDGTWSLITDVQSRRALGEDFDQRVTPIDQNSQGRPDEFVEFRATHRQFHEKHHLWTESNWLGRARFRGGPSFGTENYLRWSPDGGAWIFSLDGLAYMQRPGGALVPGENDVEWSATLRGHVTYLLPLDPKLTHYTTATVFGRRLSMEQNVYPSGWVDQDIFTPYKADHLAGLDLSDGLVARPFLDTEWDAWAGFTTNENFATVDHVTAQVAWKQLLGPAQVNLGYRYIHFFSDADRQVPIDRHLLDLDVLCDAWTRHGNRLAMGFGGIYDLTRGRASLALYLEFDFANGRFLRDFRPNVLDFTAPRRLRAVEAVGGNQVWPPH